GGQGHRSRRLEVGIDLTRRRNALMANPRNVAFCPLANWNDRATPPLGSLLVGPLHDAANHLGGEASPGQKAHLAGALGGVGGGLAELARPDLAGTCQLAVF